MSWLGPLISAGGSILGGMLSDSNDSNRYDDQMEFQDRWNRAQHNLNVEGLNLANRSFSWQTKHIQNRVDDAKQAGIHPLYALGAPGAGATFSAGGYGGAPSAPTGSGLGRGIQAAAQAIGGRAGRIRNPLERKQGELLDAQIIATHAAASRDFAEAQVASSARARTEQALNSSGAARALPGSAVASKKATKSRKTVVEPRKNASLMIQGEDSKGRTQSYYNEEVLGELADVLNAYMLFQNSITDKLDSGRTPRIFKERARKGNQEKERKRAIEMEMLKWRKKRAGSVTR